MNTAIRASDALRNAIAQQDTNRRRAYPKPALIASLPPAPVVADQRSERRAAYQARADRLATLDTARRLFQFPRRHQAQLFITPDQCARPLTRDQRRELMKTARRHARQTQTGLMPYGVLTPKVRDVLWALLDVMGPTGECFPSYTAIQKRARCCRQTVARALRVLEALGYLDRTRRLVRETLKAINPRTGLEMILTLVRQGTNLYRLNPTPKTSTVLRPDEIEARARADRAREAAHILDQHEPYQPIKQLNALLKGLITKRA